VTPKGRIVDIDPVKRPGGFRRLIVPLLFLVAAGLVAVRFLVPLKRPTLPRAVEVSDVQSAIEQEGDSLRVVVKWRMVLPRGPELAESTRVEVGISDGAATEVLRGELAEGQEIVVGALGPAGSRPGPASGAPRLRL